MGCVVDMVIEGDRGKGVVDYLQCSTMEGGWGGCNGVDTTMRDGADAAGK